MHNALPTTLKPEHPLSHGLYSIVTIVIMSTLYIAMFTVYAPLLPN